MSKQLQDAYIVAASRTPIGKAPRGAFKNTRPDELLVHAIKSAIAQVPEFDTKLIEDAIVGCAIARRASQRSRWRRTASASANRTRFSQPASNR